MSAQWLQWIEEVLDFHGARHYFTREKIQKLVVFFSALEEANRSINLTRFRTPREIVFGHLGDTLPVLHWLTQERRLIPRGLDLGAGSGFPGVSLVFSPWVQTVHWVESQQKRAVVFQQFLEKAGLPGEVHTGRAEEWGRDSKQREKWFLVCARAFAPLAMTLEIMLPLMAVGGKGVLWLSAEQSESVDNLWKFIDALGGKIQKKWEYLDILSGGKRFMLIVDKQAQTEKKWPRKWNQMTREKNVPRGTQV